MALRGRNQLLRSDCDCCNIEPRGNLSNNNKLGGLEGVKLPTGLGKGPLITFEQVSGYVTFDPTDRTNTMETSKQ